MRNSLLVVCCVLMCGSALMAQSKINSKWNCSKPSSQYKVDIGDVADHSYSLAQGNCTNPSIDKAYPEKTGAYSESEEGWKDRMAFHGHFNVTMDNGDKVFYTYEGTAPADMAKPVSNRWKIVNGTGKYKGIKGSGSCSGMRQKDMTVDYTCAGTYSIGK